MATTFMARDLLADPGFWGPRLAALEAAPPGLLLFPRTDVTRAGAEIAELQLKYGDGVSVEGLYARISLSDWNGRVDVRLIEPGLPLVPDWESVGDGWIDVALDLPGGNGLEQRVLMILGASIALASLHRADWRNFHFSDGVGTGAPDELVILELLRHRLASG